MFANLFHYSQPFATYTRVQELKGTGSKAVAVVDGYSLSIADVVAVARHNVQAQASTSKAVRDRVDASVAFLERWAWLAEAWRNVS